MYVKHWICMCLGALAVKIRHNVKKVGPTGYCSLTVPFRSFTNVLIKLIEQGEIMLIKKIIYVLN